MCCCQWVLCFLTQHNSQLRRIEKALSYIEDVRRHTAHRARLLVVFWLSAHQVALITGHCAHADHRGALPGEGARSEGTCFTPQAARLQKAHSRALADPAFGRFCSAEEILPSPARPQTTHVGSISRIGILTRSVRSISCARINQKKRRTVCFCSPRCVPHAGAGCKRRLLTRVASVSGGRPDNQPVRDAVHVVRTGVRSQVRDHSINRCFLVLCCLKICALGSFLRRKEYGKALKKFQAIDKVLACP